ncbi:Trp biosynthesis-associated membrane protein [Saccharothrix xinjiangensis]|uniref:Trp biosynthesis-associated membrane protein n=1 Tax=Saccharothrix xinjiangensis TaxID=204798 RepID=A0ABV9XTC3_9PSEU
MSDPGPAPGPAEAEGPERVKGSAGVEGARPDVEGSEGVEDSESAEERAARRARAARRRPLWIAVALLLAGAGALGAASGLTWDAAAELDGGDVVPALAPLALLCLAAIAAVVALAGWARRALGGVVLLAGVAAGFQGAGADGPLTGRALVLAGAALVVAAGALLVVRGAAMPKLGGGYQAPGAAKRSADPERELWNALERGDDPTDRD